jgi:hypothetical protein
MTIPTMSSGLDFPVSLLQEQWRKRTLVDNLDDIVQVLKGVRFNAPVRLESDVVGQVCTHLGRGGYPLVREWQLTKGSRIDIYVGEVTGSEEILSIGIEVKKGKPNTGAVQKQLKRYAATGKLNALILVTERGLRAHVAEHNGVPIRYVSLAFNWGLTV